MKQYIAIPAAILIALGVAIDANAGDKGERRGPPSFAEIDANADALISFDEMEALKANRGDKAKRRHKEDADPQARFNKVDADGDGYWSEAEFDAAKEKMRERRQERHKRHKRDKADDDESQDDSAE